MPDDIEKLKKLLRLAMATENDNEAGTAYSMVRTQLKRMGKDIHWVADQIGGSHANGGGGSYQQGYAAGRMAGLNEATASSRRRWGDDDEAYDSDWGPKADEPWSGPDPIRNQTKMKAQRWALWLLAKRSHRLSAWEKEFCESVSQWYGSPTEKQKAKLESIINKSW
jgi:hypothetical protein